MTFDTPHANWTAYGTYAAIIVLTSLIPLTGWRKKGWAHVRSMSVKIALTLFSLVLPLLLLMSWNRVEVAEGMIYIKAGGLYETSRSVLEFNLSAAQIGQHAELPHASLKWRQNGISVPGFTAGHFTLGSGRPAFVLMTDTDRTLVLPAKVGPTLIVTVADPEGMLRQLQEEQAARS